MLIIYLPHILKIDRYLAKSSIDYTPNFDNIQNNKLFEGFMESVKVCSLGQIANAMYEVGGQYRRNMVTDQMGRTIHAPSSPQRIISLVPSLTEMLFDLGLADRIVGRTKFCVHPADQVKQIQSIGGTKQFRFDIIDELQPDLIIGNKEENYVEGIEQLAASYPVWMSDIYTLDDALWMIRQLGIVVGKGLESDALADQIEAAFAQLLTTVEKRERKPRVGYFIWQKPYMVVGRQTFIYDMLERCGFINAFADFGDQRYPEVAEADIRAANLDAILLSSEPFPFAEKHRNEMVKAYPEATVHLVDGEMFSWYGSRLLKSVDYFRGLSRVV